MKSHFLNIMATKLKIIFVGYKSYEISGDYSRYVFIADCGEKIPQRLKFIECGRSRNECLRTIFLRIYSRYEKGTAYIGIDYVGLSSSVAYTRSREAEHGYLTEYYCDESDDNFSMVTLGIPNDARSDQMQYLLDNPGHGFTSLLSGK